MCTAEQTFVYVDAQTERPVRVPDAYRAPIRGFEGADLEEAG
jgi:acyl-CoA thioesterase FadM